MKATALTITKAEATKIDARLRKNAIATMDFLDDARLMKSSKGYKHLGFKTWETYSAEAIGYTPQHLNHLLKVRAVVERVAPKSEEVLQFSEPNDYQAEALSKAPPEEQAAIWADVVEEHGEKVTAAIVAEAVASRAEPAAEPEPADPIDEALSDPWWGDACRTLAKLGKQVDERFSDPLLRPHMESWSGRVVRELKGLRSTIRAATPTDRCGKCKGKGCTACLQTGLLVYGQANREAKR